LLVEALNSFHVSDYHFWLIPVIIIYYFKIIPEVALTKL